MCVCMYATVVLNCDGFTEEAGPGSSHGSRKQARAVDPPPLSTVNAADPSASRLRIQNAERRHHLTLPATIAHRSATSANRRRPFIGDVCSGLKRGGRKIRVAKVHFPLAGRNGYMRAVGRYDVNHHREENACLPSCGGEATARGIDPPPPPLTTPPLETGWIAEGRLSLDGMHARDERAELLAFTMRCELV